MKPEPFAPWQCPLCGEPLTGDTALKCGRNHSFDRAKEGYWHLLPVQSMRTKAPGDSKEMVAARRAFLNAGYYGIFGRALGELCLAYGAAAGADMPLHLLDAGCGEGWYDRCIAQAFAQAAGRCSWRALISQSLRCVWPQRHCLPQNTRWHPALPSLSAPDGPTCCLTASRPLRRKSSGACCARADG